MAFPFLFDSSKKPEQWYWAGKHKSTVSMPHRKKGRGTIEIDYFSSEDLDRILGLLGITENEIK